MTKSSRQTDIGLLRGRQLEMLCFAPYSLYLHFGDKIILTIEGRFHHRIKGEPQSDREYSFPIQETDLVRLLGERITGVKTVAKACLRLTFAHGDELVIEGGEGPYESYQLQHDGERIVV